MIKFKQFKSWFKKAYPDIELKKLGQDLYSVNMENNSAFIKNYGDHIKMIVENNVYIDDLDIVKRCKSLFGYSQCPYKYHIKDYIVKEFPGTKIDDSICCMGCILKYFMNRIDFKFDGKKIRTIIDNYIEGPIICNDGLQPDPRSTMTPKIKFSEKDKILSIFLTITDRIKK